MGLDMYAHSMPKDDNRPPVDFDVEGLHLDHTPRIHYWRKHPNLHGWMAGRYYEKGGTDDDFNVNTVELTPGDIDELERMQVFYVNIGCGEPTGSPPTGGSEPTAVAATPAVAVAAAQPVTM